MTVDTKERFMEAARLTVQDLGYSGLSFRELAKEVGVRAPAFINYFETKDETTAALVGRYTAYYAACLDELLTQGARSRNKHGPLHRCLRRHLARR
jgi:TetR/AcrR family transcriptional repressor of nem operon